VADTNIIRPQPGFQQMFVRTNVDVCIGGGVLSSGKSYAAVLAAAEPSLDPNFRALYLRNNLGDAKAGGGIIDTWREIYGDTIKIVESGDPHIDMPSGARIDITHVANQSKDAIMQRFKGRQYDLIVFDEGTGYSWDTFTTIISRNRGKSKWSGHVLMTTNPEKDHWLRVFLDWYIGDDGFIRADRNGVVRYFYINGETVYDVVWGNSKEEVYNQCRFEIDKKLKKLNKGKSTFGWENLIRSFTFYLGSMSENIAMLGNNPDYAGAVAMTGGRTAEQLLEGNWNISTKGDLDAPITQAMAEYVFENDPQVNGDRWITADLADYGTDNFVAIVWDGFHIVDILVVGRSTPKQNAMNLLDLAARYDIRQDHIIFDGTGGVYIKDYIPSAVMYVSNRPPMGVYGKNVAKLKDECYERLVSVINRRMMSCSESVALRNYSHKKIVNRITIKDEFKEECSVVMFRESLGGKKALIAKREMRKLLGKEKSPDLLDPCAMRMLPVLRFSNGEELTATSQATKADEDYDGIYVDVNDETVWC